MAPCVPPSSGQPSKGEDRQGAQDSPEDPEPLWNNRPKEQGQARPRILIKDHSRMALGGGRPGLWASLWHNPRALPRDGSGTREWFRCADDPDAVCTRSVTVRLPSQHSNVVKLKHGGGVAMDGQDVQIPLLQGDLRIQHTVMASVHLSYGEDLQIDWDGRGRLLVKVGALLSTATLQPDLTKSPSCSWGRAQGLAKEKRPSLVKTQDGADDPGAWGMSYVFRPEEERGRLWMGWRERVPMLTPGLVGTAELKTPAGGGTAGSGRAGTPRGSSQMRWDEELPVAPWVRYGSRGPGSGALLAVMQAQLGIRPSGVERTL
eukprot:bmy_18109T0